MVIRRKAREGRGQGCFSATKKPALSLAGTAVLAERYLFISSFFVASFIFALPILTDTT
jgi:hypothetical protein